MSEANENAEVEAAAAKINGIVDNLDGHQLAEVAVGLMAMAVHRTTRQEGRSAGIEVAGLLSDFTSEHHISMRKAAALNVMSK